MKSKVLLLALASMLAGGAMAQDCTFFFPTTKGTKLVKKSYDGKGNLSGVMWKVKNPAWNSKPITCSPIIAGQLSTKVNWRLFARMANSLWI